MKRRLIPWAILFSVCLVLCFSFAVSAAESYTVDGVNTVFFSDSKTVSYHGSDYSAFQSLAEGLAALGSDGGRALISGDFSPVDNLESDASFVDPVGRGPVVISGVAGAAYDKLIQTNQLSFRAGKITFDDVTLELRNTKYLAAPQAVFTDRFKVQNAGGTLFFTGGDGGSTPLVDVSVSGGTFNQFNALGVGTASLGSPSAPGYAALTIDGGIFRCFINGGSGYSNSNIYGNIIFTINDGDFSDKSVVFQRINHHLGKKIVIFNGGLCASFSAPEADIIVDASAGGSAVLKKETAAADAPVVMLVPAETDGVPYVDGAPLQKDEDGGYTLTLSENRIYRVDWQKIERPDPEVYVIDRVKTAFLSDTGDAVEYAGGARVPYLSMTEAVMALGADGGRLVICGACTYSGFTDLFPRGTLTVTGLDENAVMKIGGADVSYTFNGGKTVFDDIRIDVTGGNGVYLHGGGSLTLTEKFRSNEKLYLSPTLSRDVESAEITVEAGEFSVLDVLGSNAQVGTPEKPSHVVAVLNGGTFFRINGGWGWAAKPIYGNLLIYVNGAKIREQVAYMPGATLSGTKTVVFNNGRYLRDDGAEVQTAQEYDYVVCSDKGGTVTVEDPDAKVPVFLFEPTPGKVPFVNGLPLAMNDGVYRYIPEEKKDDTLKLCVGWKTAATVRFDANGGDGAVPEPRTGYAGMQLILPGRDEVTLEKKDCVFMGWSFDRDAAAGVYEVTLPEAAETTVYAVWVPKLPVLSAFPNLSANGVTKVDCTLLPLSDNPAFDAALNDPVFRSSAECVYAFTLTAYDGAGERVDALPNGIDLVIPDYAYTKELQSGEFLRLYALNDGKAEYLSDLYPSDGGMPFTVFASGDYLAVCNIPDPAQTLYRISTFDRTVFVDVYYIGPAAQAGFFGLKYDPSALSANGFEPDDAVGIIGAAAGVSVDRDGLYGNVWASKTSVSGTEEEPVHIGTFAFTAAEALKDDAIAPADPEACGAAGEYLPYVESLSLYGQPLVYKTEAAPAAAYIEMAPYPTLAEALSEAEKHSGTVVRLVGRAYIGEGDTVPAGTTLEIASTAFLSGEKLRLAENTCVIAEKSVYGMLTADTAVAVRTDTDGRRIYRPSGYAHDVITLDGAQIRTEGVQGLRFIVRVNGKCSDYADYGVLLLPTDISQHENMTHETPLRADVSKSGRGDDFKYFDLSDDSFRYTICITDIAPAHYDRDYTARPYFCYIAEDGECYTVYADYAAKYDLSVRDVADGLGISIV